MNLGDAAELISKYANCQECGSEMVGNGAGSLNITDDKFERTCKCGWSVTIKKGKAGENATTG